MDSPRWRNYGLSKLKNQKTFYSITYNDNICLIFRCFLTREWDVLWNSDTDLWPQSPGPHSTGFPAVIWVLSYSMCMSPCSGNLLIIPICWSQDFCLYFDSFPYELRILLETWGPLTWVVPGVSEARLTDAFLSRDPISPGWISLSLPWADSPDALLESTSFQHSHRTCVLPASPRGWGFSNVGSLVLLGFKFFYS